MRTRPSPRPSPKGEGAQRGIAAVTAILIVAVTASAATFMLAQQSAMIDQTMLVATRAQADVYARAGLDWARGILTEDGRTASAIDTLEERWAKPIAGLPVERALIAGAIADEQAKFNLNNLLNGTRQSLEDLEIFKQLLEKELGLDAQLAYAVLDWIDPDGDLASTAGAEDAYYLSLRRPYRAANQPMVQIEELYRVRGFDAATVAKLRPHVTALLARTTVNVNTAGATVLQALLPLEPKDKIAAFIVERRTKPLGTKTEIKQWATKSPSSAIDALDVKSSFFSVRIQVAQDDVELASDALVQRAPNGVAFVVWRRPRY